MSRPTRPVPECHRWQGVLAVHAPSGALEPAAALYDASCTGSRCSAFVRVPSPVDPKLRQGVCGLVGGKAEPWADTAPEEEPHA